MSASDFYADISAGDDGSVAWGQAIERALGLGYPASPASYTVYKDASNYYYRNGLTGHRSTADTNFADLMNDLILTMYGTAGDGNFGSITLQSPKSTTGNYILDKSINWRPGIYLKGEGWPGKVTTGLSGIWGGAVIECESSDITMMNIDYPADTSSVSHYGGGINNVFLVGPDYVTPATSTKPLIKMAATNNHLSDFWLNKVIAVFGFNGLEINNTTSGTDKIWNIFIDKCMWEDSTDAGLLIDSASNDIIERVRITNNHFYGNCKTTGQGGLEVADGTSTYGLVISGNTFDLEVEHSIFMEHATYSTVANNIIKDGGTTGAGTRDGIHLEDCDHIAVTGNVCDNIATANLQYGVLLDNDCTYCVVEGNSLGGATAGASTGTGVTNIVRHNTGFVTENSGTGTITNPATTAVITHGLDVTPTVEDIVVTLAENPTNAITALWVDTIGAAQFTVNVEPAPGASNLDFGWRAVVLYNP